MGGVVDGLRRLQADRGETTVRHPSLDQHLLAVEMCGGGERAGRQQGAESLVGEHPPIVADHVAVRRHDDEAAVVRPDELPLPGQLPGTRRRTSGEQFHRPDQLVPLLVTGDVPDERQGQCDRDDGDDDTAGERHQQDASRQRSRPHDDTTE
jgi:hypothetical protein